MGRSKCSSVISIVAVAVLLLSDIAGLTAFAEPNLPLRLKAEDIEPQGEAPA